MKIEVNIEKRYAIFIIGLLVVGLGVVMINAYGGSSPAVMGHSAGELDLSDGVNGEAVFNGNVGIGVAEPTVALDVSGTVKADSFVGSITEDCPSGFTKVESAGNVLGCMQSTEANGGVGLNWREANDYCFDNYGGGLPSSAEWYISMVNFDLESETIDREWTDSNGDNRDLYKVVGGGSIESQSWEWGHMLTHFRCWIPM